MDILDAWAQKPLLKLLPAFEFTWTDLPYAMSVRAQRLVAMLALAGRPLQRAVVAARLWPGVVNSRANASLRATLWGLPKEDGGPVVLDGSLLALDPRITLDLTRARGLALAIIDGEAPLSHAEGAAELLSHDLLQDWVEDWVMMERDAFRQLRLHALDVLCTRLAEAGSFARAVLVGLADVASEPSRESAHRALMTAHLLEGNRMEALRVYHRYIAMARDEMGIGPSTLMETILRAALDDSIDAATAWGAAIARAEGHGSVTSQ